jgi:hypothetical protein
MAHAAPAPDPLLPDRVRRIRTPFAWLDPRLRDRLVDLTPEEICLLFFLHLVADRQGLSFWADTTIGRKLGLEVGEVVEARLGLVRKGLVAYRYPLFQLLDLAGEGG